jgi:hypothetical protein
VRSLLSELKMSADVEKQLEEKDEKLKEVGCTSVLKRDLIGAGF